MTTRFVTFEEAAALIPDGATLSICGAWMLVPDRTLAALETRFLNTGHPRDLTAIFPICPGGTPNQPGIDRLAHPGLLKRTIGGSYPNAASALRKLIDTNVTEAYNLPTGMILGMLREISARRIGFLTECGLGTFIDPRQTGGRMNTAAHEPLLQIVDIQHREHLFLPAMPTAVAIIRATVADENGNLGMEAESATLSAYIQAAAARASGGVVIAQVQRTVPAGTLGPHEVKVPGTLVDLVVVDANQLQTSGASYDPSLCGKHHRQLSGFDPIEGVDALITRRAAREIRSGDVVVLGYGMSAHVPYTLLEEARFHEATFVVEHGPTGGLPLAGFGFGNSFNPQVILDGGSQFDLFSGGCFDIAMLSFLQADASGRINVHKVAARPHLSVGIGGFLDIATGAPRILMLGTFTAGGLRVAVGSDGVKILEEGRTRKFVDRVDEISFDPAHGQAPEILFITERATLRFDGRWHVDEVAPGIDLERDVLGQMEFVPDVSGVQNARAMTC